MVWYFSINFSIDLFDLLKKSFWLKRSSHHSVLSSAGSYSKTAILYLALRTVAMEMRMANTFSMASLWDPAPNMIKLSREPPEVKFYLITKSFQKMVTHTGRKIDCLTHSEKSLWFIDCLHDWNIRKPCLSLQTLLNSHICTSGSK